MNNISALQESVEDIRREFLARTGIRDVDTDEERAGPEVFLRFRVGRDAPIYKRALAEINDRLPMDHPYRGRLSLEVEKVPNVISSMEVQLLRSLISRTLRITSDALDRGVSVEFVPFRAGEEQKVIQPVNHAILGRRGVGKSSLILTAYRKVIQNNDLPIWLDLQPYKGRDDAVAISEVLAEIFGECIDSFERNGTEAPLEFVHGHREVTDLMNSSPSRLSVATIRKLVPELKRLVRGFTRRTGRNLFVFLDDAHLLDSALQPQMFELLHSILKGTGGCLKIAGVKNFICLYQPAQRMGLQQPGDVQHIYLDLTLVDPASAREHLVSVLKQFLKECGFSRTNQIMHDRAIDRLVWCSAGVPRDFLQLFERSVGFAIQHRRKRVGIEEVNMAVGEFGEEKSAELEQDASEDGESLRFALDKLKRLVLDDHKWNSFLVRQDPRHPGYRLLQKLVDLRLVHLIHPSINPGKIGETHEAYLLDYSFYTGVRRRRGLEEIKIEAEKPPTYTTLRKLPKVRLDEFVPES